VGFETAWRLFQATVVGVFQSVAGGKALFLENEHGEWLKRPGNPVSPVPVGLRKGCSAGRMPAERPQIPLKAVFKDSARF
jgi:hypothetical protein